MKRTTTMCLSVLPSILRSSLPRFRFLDAKFDCTPMCSRKFTPTQFAATVAADLDLAGHVVDRTWRVAVQSANGLTNAAKSLFQFLLFTFQCRYDVHHILRLELKDDRSRPSCSN